MPSRPISFSRRLYASLLRLYPADFRERYGPEMLRVFTDGCRDAYATRGVIGLLAVWARATGDLFINAGLERARAMRQMRLHRTVGIIPGAILVGVILGYLNLHNDEVQMPFAILLFSTFLLGFCQPKQAWRWALIIGLGVPLSSLLSLKIGVFYPCRPGHPDSCAGRGRSAMP